MIQRFILKYSTYRHHTAFQNSKQNFQAYSNLNYYTAIQSKAVRYSPSKYDTAPHTRIQQLEVLCIASKYYTALPSTIQNFKLSKNTSNPHRLKITGTVTR